MTSGPRVDVTDHRAPRRPRSRAHEWFTRDSIVWAVGYWAAVGGFIAAQTDWIPEPYRRFATQLSIVVGFAAGKLGFSPVPLSRRFRARLSDRRARTRPRESVRHVGGTPAPPAALTK